MTAIKNKALKEYITCFLFEEIESVTNQYIILLKKYAVCEIKNFEPDEEKTFRFYEEKLLAFFNNILEDEPLKQIEKTIEQWKKSNHNINCNHSIFYEELIAIYTILKETLFLMIQDYTIDDAKTNLIIRELELLDLKIQEYITDQYRNTQIQFKGSPS